MDGSTLQVDRAGRVAIVTLTNADRRNPLSVAAMRELAGALRELGGDADAHAVILAADGPAFSAGHDLREMTCGSGDETQYAEIFDICTELMETVQSIPQPVIVGGRRRRHGGRLSARRHLRSRRRLGAL